MVASVLCSNGYLCDVYLWCLVVRVVIVMYNLMLSKVSCSNGI